MQNGQFRAIALTLLLLLASQWAAPGVCRAQCAPLLPTSVSGDSFIGNSSPNVNDLINNSTLRASFTAGVNLVEAQFQSDAFGNSCTSVSDTTCGLRRILNALVLINDVQSTRLAMSYKAWVDGKVLNLQKHSGCDNYSYVDGTQGCSDVHLWQGPIFETDLMWRAGEGLVHESRHIHSKRHCGSSWNICQDSPPGDCDCTNSDDSCDPSWEYDGANRYHAEFEMDTYLQQYDLNLPVVMRDLAVTNANILLNGRFGAHPGFNFVGAGGVYQPSENVESWTMVAGVSAPYAPPQAYSAYPARLTVGALRRFSIQLRTNEGYVNMLETCYTPLRFVEGVNSVFPPVPASLATTQCVYRHDEQNTSNNGPLYTVSIPARDSGANPNAITRIQLRAGTGGNVDAIRVEYRGIINDLATGTLGVTGVGAYTTGSWDVDLMAPFGYFYSGLGLNAGSSTFFALAGKFSLGPSFERLGGGFGGSVSGLLTCPIGEMPVGVTAKAASAPFGTGVGYFGILCADADDTRSGLHAVGLTSEPTGSTRRLCNVGERLRGLRLLAGAEVDFVDFIYCTGSVVQVDIGGTGGQVVAQDCGYFGYPDLSSNPANNAPYFYVRSGARIDQIVTGCHSETNVGDSFELNEGIDIAPPCINCGFERDSSGNSVSGTVNGASDVDLNFAPGGGVPSSDEGWRFVNNGAIAGFPANATTGSRFAYADAGSVVTYNEAEYLESREIDLQHVHFPEVALEFDYLMRTGIGATTLEVQVAERGGAFSTIQSHTILAEDADMTSFQPIDVDLSDYRGSIIRVRFKALCGWGNVAIDSVRLHSL